MTFVNPETFRDSPYPKDLPLDFSYFLEAPSFSSSQSPVLPIPSSLHNDNSTHSQQIWNFFLCVCVCVVFLGPSKLNSLSLCLSHSYIYQYLLFIILRCSMFYFTDSRNIFQEHTLKDTPKKSQFFLILSKHIVYFFRNFNSRQPFYSQHIDKP